MELIDGGLSLVVVLKVDETETFGLAVLVTLKDARGDLAVLGEELLKLIVGDLGVDVLGVDVGEASTRLLDLGLTLLAGDVVTDVDLLVVQKHAVDVLDGSLGSLGGLVVDETVAERASVVGGDLARKNVTESGKGIVKGLVVDTGVEVLDEDVALTGASEGGVTLRPHDTARTVADERVVELLHGTLAVVGVEEVDVGVAERATGDGVTGRHGCWRRDRSC